MGKIGPQVVEDARTWPHSRSSVDQSVFLLRCDDVSIALTLVEALTDNLSPL
jgi:hypothetical protein